jgi:hypothetical protein
MAAAAAGRLHGEIGDRKEIEQLGDISRCQGLRKIAAAAAAAVAHCKER